MRPFGPDPGLQASYRAARGALASHRVAVVQRTVLVEAGSDSKCQERQPDALYVARCRVGRCADGSASDERHGATAGCRLGYSGRRRASRSEKRVGRETFSHASTLVSALQDASWALTSRQLQCSNQQWSAPCQQAEIHAQHQAKQARCTRTHRGSSGGRAAWSSQRGDRGPARRAHQHPLKSKAVPSRTHT
jgi:hypothetical protein